MAKKVKEMDFSGNVKPKENKVKSSFAKALKTAVTFASVAAMLLNLTGCLGGKKDNTTSSNNNNPPITNTQPQTGGNQTTEPGLTQLSAPTGLVFDATTNSFSWNEVMNADYYVVDINGTETTETDTTCTVDTLEVGDNTLSVYACGEGYNTSATSSITYELEETQQSELYDDVKTAIQSILPSGTTLDEVVYANINSELFVICSKCTKLDKQYYNECTFELDRNDYTIEEAITKLDTFVKSSNSTKIVNYDSFSAYIKSEAYVSQIKSYVDKGWDVEVISSATTDYDRGLDVAIFNSYGVLKLTKGSETKYAFVNNRYGVSTLSSDIIVFEGAIEYPEGRQVNESYFGEITDEQAISICESIDGENRTSTPKEASRYVNVNGVEYSLGD